MAVSGLIPGTQDWGVSENKVVQSLFPWLKQINNPLVPKVQAAEPKTIPSINNQAMYPSQSFGQISAYKPPPTKQINNNSGNTGNNNQDTGFQYPETNIVSPNDSLGGGPSQQDIINQQFNDFNNYMSQQESQAQSNFSDTKGLYDTMKTNAENQYNTEKTTQTQDIKKNEALNLKKVRQLLSDLAQGNAARVAIGGGGSISEVLGERFGREAQSRLGGVMDSAQSAIQRVGDFYNNAITKLNETYQANIMDAKQKLDENLSNIRYQKQASATSKQAASLDAWRTYYDNVNRSKIQAATFKAQYDLWKQQQDSALAATQGFNEANANTYNTGVTDALSNTPQAPGIQQQQDQYNTTNPFQVMSNKKNSPEDEYQKQLAALGLTDLTSNKTL